MIVMHPHYTILIRVILVIAQCRTWHSHTVMLQSMCCLTLHQIRMMGTKKWTSSQMRIRVINNKSQPITRVYWKPRVNHCKIKD